MGIFKQVPYKRKNYQIFSLCTRTCVLYMRLISDTVGKVLISWYRFIYFHNKCIFIKISSRECIYISLSTNKTSFTSNFLIDFRKCSQDDAIFTAINSTGGKRKSLTCLKGVAEDARPPGAAGEVPAAASPSDKVSVQSRPSPLHTHPPTS